MDKSLMFIISILFVFLTVVGCSEPVDKNNDLIEKTIFDDITENKEIVKKEPATETKKQVFSSYSLEQLQNDIESNLSQTTLMWEESSEKGYYENTNKYYVINKLSNQIKKPEDFYDKFRARNWEGQLHFLNKTAMSWLHTPLEEKDFDNSKRYKDYTLYRSLIEQTTKETFIQLEHGDVLEYQHINWMFNQFGYFDGAWEDTLLIYKIYCSPDFVVLLRPKWEQLNMGMSGAKKEAAHNNWKSLVKSVRPDMLNLADIILEKCPVEKDFFNSIKYEDYEETKTLSYHYETDLEFYWELSTSIGAEIKPSEDNDDEYLLERINVTITNNDTDSIYNFFLRVNVYPDGKKGRETFIEDRKIGTVFAPGKTAVKTQKATEDITFKNNITISVIPLSDNDPVKPTNYILFNDGRIEEI